MRDFDTLSPLILPTAPACPDPTLVWAVRKSLTELCERARIWRAPDHFEVTETGPEVLFVPQGAHLHKLETVAVNDGKPLEPITLIDLERRYPDWRKAEGMARFVVQTAPGTLSVTPSQVGDVIRLVAYLKPSPTADSAPRHLLDRYEEIVSYGALARILAIPRQEWSDPSLAAYYLQSFNSRIDPIAYDYLKGDQDAPLRSRPQFF